MIFGPIIRRIFCRGFPWLPTGALKQSRMYWEGSVEHGDSMKNKGVISPGDVQWMTAAAAVFIHQEMPKGDKKGRMGGFQLWANLPAKQKMMDPRYRDMKKNTIPEVKRKDGNDDQDNLRESRWRRGSS